MTASGHLMDVIFYEKIHIICQNIIWLRIQSQECFEISLFYYKNRKITAFNSACGHAHNFFPLEKIITKDN